MTKKLIREGRPRPKIAIVLGSGGVKSMGGVELFDQLHAREIPIDLIVGCSGGSIIGALMAMGRTVDEVRFLITQVFTPHVFSVNYKALGAMLKIPFLKFDESMGIFKAIDPILSKIYQGKLIEQSLIPLMIQATDLQTGEGVVITKGDCAKAVAASSAAVPFIPPCFIEGRWLIDGAFSQPLPILEAVKADIDIIIAMSFDEMPVNTPTNFMSLATHAFNKGQRNAIYTQTGRAISFHHHEIVLIPLVFDRVINLWEAHSIPIVYEKAKVTVTESMSYVEKAIDDFYELQDRAR